MRPHDVAPLEPARGASRCDAFACSLFGPFEMTLARRPDAPAMARAAVTAWMTGHVDQATLADVQLLVGALVANSVGNADAADDAVARVRVEVSGERLHLEVADARDGRSVARWASQLERGGGSGRNVVGAVARRWGVARCGGTRVWAEIGLPAGARGPAVDRRAAGSPDSDRAEHARPIAAQMAADRARGRAGAARHAGDRAAPEYARRSHDRIADLRDAMARQHEDVAWRLWLRGVDGSPDAA